MNNIIRSGLLATGILLSSAAQANNFWQQPPVEVPGSSYLAEECRVYEQSIRITLHQLTGGRGILVNCTYEGLFNRGRTHQFLLDIDGVPGTPTLRVHINHV